MRITDVFIEKPKFVSPEKVLKEIGLKSGDEVADYGSGAGHWTIPAAKIVGSKGKVFAIEDNIEMLSLVKSKADVQGLKNIEVEELNLEKEKSNTKFKVDLLIIANVLHSIKDKLEFLRRAIALQKDGGKLLVVDWRNGQGLFGPSDERRLSEEEVISMCETVGLHFVCTADTGWHHFGLLFDKGELKNEKK